MDRRIGTRDPLREEGAETVLSYNVDAQVGGKIAQVGARLIDGTAKKLADEFFGKFATLVGGPPVATSDGAATAAAPAAAAQRGYKHWLIIGVGAIILIAVFLASR